jgi:hypothetical protein
MRRAGFFSKEFARTIRHGIFNFVYANQTSMTGPADPGKTVPHASPENVWCRFRVKTGIE